MMQKATLRRSLAGFYVLQFSALFLWLTRSSYHAREFLVCWLFFCSAFAVLALILLGAVLACYAGQTLVKRLSVAKTVIPESLVCLGELPQEVSSGPRIIVAGAVKLAAGPYAAVNALDDYSCQLIEVAPLAEDDVRN
jgi:hypothetical protein